MPRERVYQSGAERTAAYRERQRARRAALRAGWTDAELGAAARLLHDRLREAGLTHLTGETPEETLRLIGQRLALQELPRL